MADKIVQEVDGTSFIDLEDGTGDILLEVDAGGGPATGFGGMFHAFSFLLSFLGITGG